MIKKLFGPAIVYALAGQIGMIVSFFVLPVTTPYLTKFDFGIYGTIYSYVGAISVLQTLGLNIIFANAYYRHRDWYKYIFRSGLGLLHLWNFVYTVILGGLLWVIIPEEVLEYRWQIILLNCLPSLLLGMPEVAGRIHYQVRRKPWGIFFGTLLAGCISAAVNIYTVVYLGYGWLGLIWAVAAAAVVQKIYFLLDGWFRDDIYPVYKFNRAAWRDRLKVALPIVPHYYSNYLLNSSDKVVMDVMSVPMNQIGEYSAAGRFGSLVSAGASALNQAVAPLILAAIKKGDFLNARLNAGVVQLVLFAATICLSLSLPEIFPMLFRNPELLDMIPLCVPIIMAYNYRGMYVASSTILFYAETTKRLWRISFVAGALNVALNILLIPRFGVEAAAWTTWLAFMYMGYAGFYMRERRELMVGKPDVNWYAWFMATIVVTAVGVVGLDQSILIRYAVIVMACGSLAGVGYIMTNKKNS